MRALEVEEASQRRFLLVAGVAVGNDWALVSSLLLAIPPHSTPARHKGIKLPLVVVRWAKSC